MDDGFLRLIGLARRARRAELGEEGVCGAIAEGRARVVFLAEDAGASVARQAAYWTGQRNIPLLTVPYGKASLGASCGRASCAVLTLTDTGFAVSAVEKLPTCKSVCYDEALALLRAADARIRDGRRKKQRRRDTGHAPRPSGKKRKNESNDIG